MYVIFCTDGHVPIGVYADRGDRSGSRARAHLHIRCGARCGARAGRGAKRTMEAARQGACARHEACPRRSGCGETSATSPDQLVIRASGAGPCRAVIDGLDGRQLVEKAPASGDGTLVNEDRPRCNRPCQESHPLSDATFALTRAIAVGNGRAVHATCLLIVTHDTTQAVPLVHGRAIEDETTRRARMVWACAIETAHATLRHRRRSHCTHRSTGTGV